MGAYNSKAEAAGYTKTHSDDEESLKQNKEEAVITIDHEDLVYDKTPLSIGSACVYDELWVQIPRNTTIPTNKFEFFMATALDNQESMKLSFYQGERAKASDNKLLGTLEFKGIPPAPCGVAEITFCVDVDGKGNLNVSAEDKSTGRKETMSVPGVGVKGKLLTAEEVAEMARQGEKHESEDDEYVEKVNAMRAMKEYAIVIRENAAAGDYSRKTEDGFRDVVDKMLDEFKEKATEFGLEGDRKMHV